MHTMGFGKYPDSSIEWVAIHDPDYMAWMVRESVAPVHLRGAALDRFNFVADRAERVRLFAACCTCGQFAEHIDVVVKSETVEGKTKVKKVSYRCEKCVDVPEDCVRLPPSLLAWSMIRNGDKFGSAKVRDGILFAGLKGFVLNTDQEGLEEFFDNDKYFVAKKSKQAA